MHLLIIHSRTSANPASLTPSFPTSTLGVIDVRERGTSNSITLTLLVTLHALLPIPSLNPFAPASFMFSRRRAPTEDKMAGLPSDPYDTMGTGDAMMLLEMANAQAIINLHMHVEHSVNNDVNNVLVLVNLRYEIYDLIPHNDLNELGNVQARIFR